MLKFGILVIYILSMGAFANAEVFTKQKNTEVFLIDNPSEDEVVRLDILSRAKYSIQIVAHIQDASLFGSKITEVIRGRMAEGVSLTYVYEKVASAIGGDMSDKSVNLLKDASLYDGRKSRIYINRPLERLETPFSIHDLFHEKIIIVDGGTPNETIMIGGRNHDMHGVEFSDLTFVLRPIEPGKAYLGDTLKEHYEKIIKITDTYFSVESPRVVKPKELLAHAAILAKGQYAPSTPKTMAIKKALNELPKRDEALLPYQSHPSWARLVTNDLFQTIIDKKLKKQCDG